MFPKQHPASTFALRVLPAGVVAAAAVGAAWLDRGSIAPEDWLPWAVLVALLLAASAWGGGLQRPTRAALTAGTALAALAVWDALSLAWAPLPAAARDESLLVLAYLACFALGALVARSDTERLAAAGVVGVCAAGLALATAAKLVLDAEETLFFGGRLAFPVSYANAQAALFLIGFWPALAVASTRHLPVLLRAVACAGAAAAAGGWMLTQSKGAGIALLVSAVAVLALSPLRLRLLVPLVLAAAPLAVAAVPLTEPYREAGTAPMEGAGLALLGATLAAAVLGLAYALVDRRVHLSPSARRRLGAAVAVGAAATVVAAAVVVQARTDPVERVRAAWTSFKQPASPPGATHFVSLGSNRYDFWRVALQESREQPLVGAGARSFGPIYLREGRSSETPTRTHSLPLEALLETGAVGLLLLLVAVGVPLVAAARTGTAVGAAALGAAAYWLVHSTGDWIWTVPAAGMPFFLLLGLAVAGEERPLTTRAAVGSAAAIVTAVVVLLVPPWLSARLSRDALRNGDPARLDLAGRLDPLSPQADLVRSVLARTPAAAVAALEDAVARAPEAPELRVALAEALLSAGRPAPAVAELRRARDLNPRDPGIARRLREAEARALG